MTTAPLRSVIDLLTVDATEPRTGAESSRAALIDLLLIHTLRIWEKEGPADDWATISDPVIASALKKLHASPEHPWSVQLLGTAAGLSRTAFTRRFTAIVGRPPMAYLTAWRLNNGAQLLRETDASLGTIARRVDYSSEFAFSSAFRRQFGTSPGHFRRATRN